MWRRLYTRLARLQTAPLCLASFYKPPDLVGSGYKSSLRFSVFTFQILVGKALGLAGNYLVRAHERSVSM